jgi:uncharacterized protein YjiS (DUF1127 family)
LLPETHPPTRRQQLKQSRLQRDIMVKHARTISDTLGRNALKKGVQKMFGTQDVLEELAEWYSPRPRSARAGRGAIVVRRSFAPSSRSETLGATPKGRLVAGMEKLLAWHDRARQRRALLQLSDDMLGDIGISRAQALAEAEKNCWRA